MKKTITVLAILTVLFATSCAPSYVRYAHRTRNRTFLFSNGDTVKVKRRKSINDAGYAVYVIVGNGYFRPNSNQVLYNCRDTAGNIFTRLPQISIL